MKSAETCSCSLCNKLNTYLYHHIVVLDKYIHPNLVYYKHNGVTNLMTRTIIQCNRWVTPTIEGRGFTRRGFAQGPISAEWSGWANYFHKFTNSYMTFFFLNYTLNASSASL